MPVDDDFRNPIIIPELQRKKPCCPKCGCERFGGRRVQGVVTFTCSDCRNQWQGGLPREPWEKDKPIPPENPKDKPLVDFAKNSKGQTEEIRRRVDPTPDFRKGALVPNDGEE
jgi:hypothetical protein